MPSSKPNPRTHTTDHKPEQVEIKLKKASSYQWADLVASSSASAAPTPASAPAPVPTAPAAAPAPGGNGGKGPRPYASHKDWEAVEREIAKELEGEKVGCWRCWCYL